MDERYEGDKAHQTVVEMLRLMEEKFKPEIGNKENIAVFAAHMMTCVTDLTAKTLYMWLSDDLSIDEMITKFNHVLKISLTGINKQFKERNTN